MNLKKISIENFKCFGSQVDIDFGRLTLLTGANSSGKTSIIYSILGALQSGEFPFQFSTNGKYVNMGNFKDIVHNHNRKERIKLGFTFEDSPIKEIKTLWVEDEKNNLPKLFELNAISINRPELSDSFSLSIKAHNAKYFADFTYGKDMGVTYEMLSSEKYKWFEESNRDFESFSLRLGIPVEKDNKLQNVKRLEIDSLPIDMYKVLPSPEYDPLVYIINSISEILVEFDRQINFIGPFRFSNERTYYEQSKAKLKVNSIGEGYLDQIIYWETNKDPKLKQLIASLKKLKLLHSIRARRVGGGKYEILVKVKKDGIETPLSDVGAGVSQFLPILVADLQLPDGSTLFIAEPESHLHPSAQSSFGDYLTNQIKSTSKNYVIEAHSEYLLNKIRLSIVKGDLKEEDVKVLFLDNDGDKNVIHNIGFTSKGRIINAPKNFFKTYMIDVMDIAINASE